ncbi:RNA polymerase, sigma 54 subunit, RpoN/SigL [Limimonas halophila]|uniref:RNA polymerase sigma-54 factor n=1 Tax=Limimonas halophila TaxID=1082479 RepID=A0A1G7TD47_9PROT|nr:RNA polymerase factor sigma-54 [Limimonas halophila]SDG33155.1 RNA polymerase, sigma 54 subunit, RpoN/SigL [Limimonas halophila]
MAISQRLEVRQSQSLVMTPQLQQAIKLLQYANLDLAAYVDQEVEQNPLLEHAASEETERDVAPAESRRGDEDDLDDRGGDAGDWDGAPPQLADWSRMPAGGGSDDDGGIASFEQRLADSVTLRDHLLNQALPLVADARERAIAESLVDNLDEAGYLAAGVDELAALLGTDAEAVESVRQRLLGLDPTGVFARSLAECLSAQLRERDRLDPAMQALMDNLALVEDRQFDRLRRLCGVEADDLSDMLAELRALDPRPALAFGGGTAQTVVPDILMHRHPDGGFTVELNRDTLPRVLVNNRYYARIAAEARSKDDTRYLNERLQSANWLTRALDQRAQTILRVTREIVRRQHLFFVKGIEFLRPMTLREVAESVDMHESTVSRVTANKHIATPRGTFELKSFFTAAIQGSDGQAHSAEAVRHRIKALIDAETPGKVLSDDRIVTILRGEGIDIARRTVAKYRESMGIPSSSRRKRAKAAAS